MSEPNTPSRTVGVFLGTVVVSLRQTGMRNTDLLDRLGAQLSLTIAEAEHFGLSEDDIHHLRQMERVFRNYLNNPELGLFDPSEGSA